MGAALFLLDGVRCDFGLLCHKTKSSLCLLHSKKLQNCQPEPVYLGRFMFFWRLVAEQGHFSNGKMSGVSEGFHSSDFIPHSSGDKVPYSVNNFLEHFPHNLIINLSNSPITSL